MSITSEYDVAVVGASVAGCTTAALLGRAGAKVALLEQRPDPRAYKTVCTHFIQASATPTLERLGLTERIEAAGADPQQRADLDPLRVDPSRFRRRLPPPAVRL